MITRLPNVEIVHCGFGVPGPFVGEAPPSRTGKDASLKDQSQSSEAHVPYSSRRHDGNVGREPTCEVQ